MFESCRNGELPFRTMTLTGQGHVTMAPDVAVIRLGVQLSGSDLAAVQAQNAQQSQAVLDALRRMGVTDIKTFQYTIDKYYENVNGTSVDRGYTVRNIFEIRTDDISAVGAVIDAAVGAGANAVDLISFEASNPEYYYQQALNLAVADTVEKARSVSVSLGIPVQTVPVSITESSAAPRPMQAFQREYSATPVVPGSITVDASVTAEFIF